MWQLHYFKVFELYKRMLFVFLPQQKWSTALMQHAADHRRWKIAATKRLALGSLAEVDLYSSTNDSEQPSRSHKKPRYTKSFKRTRSKLVILYNQAGIEDELI